MTIGFNEANNNTRNIYDDIREWKTGAWGWMHGGDLMEQNTGGVNSGVYGNFTDESWDRYHNEGFRGNPLIDTNPHDIANILALYQTDRFNPYANNHYAHSGKEVAEGSIADVLYGLTKDRNRDKRMGAYKAIRSYQGDLGQDRMTQRLWNERGLNEVFGDYAQFNPNDPMAGPNPLLSGGGTSPVSDIQWQGSNMLSGDTSNVGTDLAPAPATGNGFLGAYRARKQELESTRPSVRSLFKEMEDYENE